MYNKEARSQLPGLYHLVLEKAYLKEENTWETSAAVMHLQKLINTFHKDHSEKAAVTSLPLNSALSMARPIVPKEPNKNMVIPAKEPIKEVESDAIKMV